MIMAVYCWDLDSVKKTGFISLKERQNLARCGALYVVAYSRTSEAVRGIAGRG
jgi:hypothetical protein